LVTWELEVTRPLKQVTAFAKGSLKIKGIWSGRGDLNARPPAPKADSGLMRKCPIFNGFYFNEMRPDLLNPVELY
jgi:hypothetical protein